jgi:hypothetical protein
LHGFAPSRHDRGCKSEDKYTGIAMTVCFKVSEIPEKNRLTGALLYILQITTCVLIKGIELQPPDQQPDGNIVKTTFNIRSTKRAGKIMKKVDQWAFLAFLDMRQ